MVKPLTLSNKWFEKIIYTKDRHNLLLNCDYLAIFCTQPLYGFKDFMTFSIITTQPGIYDAFLKTGLISRAIDKGIIDIKIQNLHDYATDIHRSIDDTPAGGGPGMVLKVDVMKNALDNILKTENGKRKTILLTPQGKKFTQSDTKRLSKLDNLILIAGRFEGYDERIRDLVDEEISIGDFVLTSGDLPAQMIIDATSRMFPGLIDKTNQSKKNLFH
jgi:tRNA (guanine37-N1)-methyltransferase